MALQWNNENIHHFGGKRSTVTLFGFGAGASSATAHIFANGSKKYFSRVVAASGTIFNDWALKSRLL